MTSPVDIYVIRDDGDKQGPDIINGLLSSVQAAILAGQTAIDDSESVYIISLETMYRASVEMGQLVEVHDSLQGASWRGKIIGITHSKQGPRIFTELEIARPVRFDQ